jgi:hypothetical protein
MHTEFGLVNLKRRGHLGDLGVDARIIFKSLTRFTVE